MAGLGSIYMVITVLISCVFVVVYSDGCPQHPNNPNNVNGRINMLKNQGEYTVVDDTKKYRYSITICQTNNKVVAVQQTDIRTKNIYNAGTYDKATVRGGTNWLIVSYGDGQSYRTQCGGGARRSDLLITCDPNESRGTLKVIKEFRTNPTFNPDSPCYFLFQLNHKAACTAGPPETPTIIILIITFVIVVSVCFVLGFLYWYCFATEKRFEQMPNYNKMRKSAYGSLQAGQDETVPIVSMNEDFHVKCCEDCKLQLSSEKGGDGCYPLDGHLYCKDCNAKHIQKLTAELEKPTRPLTCN